MKITDQMVAAANAEAPELKPETVRRMLEASFAANPNGKADELANRLVRLHRDLEDRGDKGADWSIARALEDRIGSYQPTPGDFDRAELLLKKYAF